jgi:glycosyltransferase involved in cell wall biosynthesis
MSRVNTGPLVSVIIPCYNAARYVAEAVASALAQTYQPLEVILINDGSTDDTEEVLLPYVGKIRYFYQPNRGLSATRNRAIALARGELIAFLDADDVWLPEKLERQVDRLTQNPRAGLVHANFLKLYADTGIRAPRKPPDITDGRCYTRLVLGNILLVSSVVLRRECLDRVGVFDENIPRRTCEDYDLWLRIARYFEFAYIPEALMLYRRHAGNMSNNTRAMLGDELYVVQKALNTDPSLAAQVGKQALHRRLAGLLFTLGYLCFNDGDLTEAGLYFRQALRFCHSPYTFMLWAATFLPSEVVTKLRSFKQSLARQKPAAPVKRLRVQR